MKKRILSIILAVVMITCMIPISAIPATAAESVTYVDRTWDATNKKVVETEKTATAEPIESSTTAITLSGGWYVVDGDVTIDDRIIVDGNATTPTHIILKDGAKLTASSGIDVPDGKTLFIYGQEAGTGILEATGGKGAAGIGSSGEYDNCGNITINGGNVTASSLNVAGIGSSFRGRGGTVTINGGTVNATGGEYGAGIGGGRDGSGGTVTINGGTVNATGGLRGAGIGGLNANSGYGSVTINGGTVNATGGELAAGIGGSNFGRGCNVTVNGGNITAIGGVSGIGQGNVSEYPGVFTVNGGNITAIGGVSGIGKNVYSEHTFIVNCGVLIKAGENGADTVKTAQEYNVSRDRYVNIHCHFDADNNEICDFEDCGATLMKYKVGEATESVWSPISLKDETTLYSGWYCVEGDVTINERITINNDTTNPTCIILKDGATLNATKGINVPINNMLIIYGQDNDNGKLIATGYESGAGIGGDAYQKGGQIVIYGGNITATGGANAAGIGGGVNTTQEGQDPYTCHAITINGGTVTATGGDAAAGIGGGLAGTCNYISIGGGNITATGGSMTSGIGSGRFSREDGYIILTDLCAIKAGEQSADTLMSVDDYMKGTFRYVTIHVHTPKEVKAKEPTCTEDGISTSYWVCSGGNGSCGKYYNNSYCHIELTPETVASYTTQKLGHSFTAFINYEDNKWISKCCRCDVYDEDNILTGVSVPTAITGLVFNSTEQEGVAEGNGYTLSGNKATAVGKYTATATLESGYVWSDGTIENKTIEWEILPLTLSATYIDRTWNDSTKTIVETEKTITDAESLDTQTTLIGGWYVVDGDVTISDRIFVNGDATNPTRIILKDGAKLNAEKGIHIEAGKVLYIYAQKAGTGILEAKGEYQYSGIGSYASLSGDVIINGGNINATGGYGATGIGGGYMGTAGTIIVNGGNVTATGGDYAAGIGGGYNAWNASGNLTVNDGNVTAIGGCGAAGIGGGYVPFGDSGTVTINGGTVTAIGSNYNDNISAGIGGCYKNKNSGSLIINYNAIIKAGANSADTVKTLEEYISSRDMYVTITKKVVVSATYIDRTWNDSTKTIVESEKTTTDAENLNTQTALFGGWYVVDGDVTISDRITVNGNATNPTRIILKDGAKLNAEKGILIPAGKVLYIYAQKAGTGILEAKGEYKYSGIGSDSGGFGGDLIINGGNINATGGSDAAGIGGGYYGTAGTIIVNGGNVTATGGSYSAGIGGGYSAMNAGGNLTVNGGNVTAIGGDLGAGIGGGYNTDDSGTVTINGGTVTAIGSNYNNKAGAGIGGCFKNKNIGSLIINCDATIKAGENSADTVKTAEEYISSRDRYITITKNVSVTDSHILSGKCDSFDGKGGLMGRQVNKNDATNGRTIIGLTAEQLDAIGDNLVIVGGDLGKETTVEIDCAYTYFYNGETKITAESMNCAAFVIIDADANGNHISGYGYYRIYNESAETEDNFMFDTLFAAPVIK